MQARVLMLNAKVIFSESAASLLRLFVRSGAHKQPKCTRIINNTQQPMKGNLHKGKAKGVQQKCYHC